MQTHIFILNLATILSLLLSLQQLYIEYSNDHLTFYLFGRFYVMHYIELDISLQLHTQLHTVDGFTVVSFVDNASK